jgi:hypothetical protein
MKKFILVLIVIILAFLLIGAQAPPAQNPPAKPEEFAKNIVRIEKPEAVPESMKAGFETIAAKDSLAMLSFIASDLMEGRETGTRGFQLAAEYAASLLGLWKIKPLGDVPPRAFTLAQFLSGATPPAPPDKGFLQEFALQEITETSSRMSLEVKKADVVRTRPFQSGQDYQGLPTMAETISSPIVFAGYGISEKDIGYDDFKNFDVKGKIVLILSDAPGRDNPESPFQRNKALKDKYFPARPAGGIIIVRPGDSFNKVSEIRKRRPAAILQVANPGIVSGTRQDAAWFRSQLPPKAVNDEQPIIKKPYRRTILPGLADPVAGSAAPFITITRETANALLEASGQTIDDLKKKIETTWKPASLELPGTRLTIESTVKSQLVRGINVVGAIEGSDPALKDEIVVVGAHLDHTGQWEDYIYNGADDNGSGSVGILNLARAFSTNAQKPKRTIVFCLWGGEEKGLLGSRYFVQNSPYPKARIIAYLNMDMISRPYDEKSLGFAGRMMNFPVGPDFLKLVKPANFMPIFFAAGSGLGDIIREADRYIGLDLYLREATESSLGFGSSDHASFHEAKIPWLLPISAVTGDLHQTSDSVDKVSSALIEKVSKLMYVIAFQLTQK